MRLPLRTLALASLLLLTACRARHLADEAYMPQNEPGPMPPNTILLSDMMQQLSARPGFTEAFLKQVQGAGGKRGAALLTPTLIHDLRDEILGQNWQGLDRFPGWTMHEINPTVRVLGHEAGKDAALGQSATAGGAPATRETEARAQTANEPAANQPDPFLDLGDFAHPSLTSVDFDKPARGRGFILRNYVAKLGDGITRGDGPDPDRALRHNESARLADALNRLALNPDPTLAPAGRPGAPPFTALLEGQPALTPEALIDALTASGHTVMVADSRYFANFGHLHFQAPGDPDQDVMMPFWVNSQILIPDTNRSLLVPVSHAEYEWFIRGPKVNAEVSFYFGIDGKAEFRTMDQLDQPWVMNRHAHEYRDDSAREVTRLASAMVRTYMHLHHAHPAIPFGGYYAFGVCQDVVAAIELKLTGRTTLFPNTADSRFFTDPADREINTLIDRIPKDRDGRQPSPERIFGSLPVGTSDYELGTVSIPGLSRDLILTHHAWTQGRLQHVESGWRKALRYAGILAAFTALLAALAYANNRAQLKERAAP